MAPGEARTSWRALWRALLKLSWRRRLALPWRLLRDPRVPPLAKAIVPLVLLYLVLPLDIIPDFIPVLGQLDDLLVTALGVWLLLRLCPREVLAEHLGLEVGAKDPPA
jgi:uncharacterized membrane protein YkvA (DUF1232 family)